MTDKLRMCPECKRHVMARESSCPFCTAKLAGGVGLVATVAAAVVVGVSACGDSKPAQGPNDVPSATTGTTAPTSPTATPTNSGRGDKNPVPVYGGPPPP